MGGLRQLALIGSFTAFQTKTVSYLLTAQSPIAPWAHAAK